jgi:hypothetical protein
MNEFMMAIESIKTASSILNSFNKLKSLAEVQLKVVELTNIIIPLQARIEQMSIQQTESNDTILKLRNKNLKLTDWESNKPKYKLITFKSGSSAYTKEENISLTTGSPYYCQNCYNNSNSLSVYQPVAAIEKYMENVKHSCPVCHNNIYIPNANYKPHNSSNQNSPVPKW